MARRQGVGAVKIAYDIEEAAALCSLSENALRELIRQGKIIARQCGASRALRVGHAELVRFFTTPEEPSEAVVTCSQSVVTPHAPRRTTVRSGAPRREEKSHA
jgi:Helix-turn-helix domain